MAPKNHIKGDQEEKRLHCRICGAEMVRVLAAYDRQTAKGKRTTFKEEIECINCGKATDLPRFMKPQYSRITGYRHKS